jgi:sugar phosphate isomerase/epimerase
MKLQDDVHLTYCSNIHPGETWEEVRANLERYVPTVRDAVAPGQPFGIGLRLSAQAAQALSQPATLQAFREFLDRNDFYIFTLNGFPYGTFHGARVKEDVYLPDWRDPARLGYTDLLADLLADLLPEGMHGTVSTVPGAFKPAMHDSADVERIVDGLLRHVAHLVKLEQRTGVRIALALEPEPSCFLETVEETVGFFKRHLLSAAGVRRLAELTGNERAAAANAVHTHLGVCLDLCHAAVEFEDPVQSLRELDKAGIQVSKMQISAGLRLPELSPGALAALKQFQDPVYLHQVIESGEHGLRRFVDLPEALASLETEARAAEWRVHFHVPIFLEELEAFSSTRFFIREVLARHRVAPVSQHLEVETYTWGVLPEQFRSGGVEQAVARELNWVRQELAV